jgi:RNase P subunit RPR2
MWRGSDTMIYKCETQRLGTYIDEKAVWTCIECGHERLYNFTGKRRCGVNDR